MNGENIQIIAHRGIWKFSYQKNQLESLILALENGFGLETDLRDCNGQLVISHDPPNTSKNPLILFEDLLEYYSRKNKSSTLALNIKSDGLYDLIKYYLGKYSISNYFLFDMSIPDFLQYSHKKLNIFCRYSEYEDPDLLLNKSEGLWLDCFSQKNYEELKLEHFFKKWQNIAIVSPELHGLDYEYLWQKLKILKSIDDNIKLFLCTDKPKDARVFFDN